MQTIPKISRRLSVLIVAVQILLSASFLWSSYTKFLTPAERLAQMWPWTAAHPMLVAISGITDLLVGLGLILPSIFKIYTRLVLVAAIGSIVMMAAASIFHIARGEASQIGINITFAILAAFIAWGHRKD